MTSIEMTNFRMSSGLETTIRPGSAGMSSANNPLPLIVSISRNWVKKL